MPRVMRTIILVVAASAAPSIALAQGGAGVRLTPPAEAAPVEGDFAARSPFSFFGEGGLALDLRGDEPTPLFRTGFGLAYQLHQSVGLGVRSTGFGISGAGDQISVHLHFSPYLELGLFVDPHVQLYTQLGTRIGAVFGSPLFGEYVDVWLTVRGGVRFWLTDWMTIGIEAGFDLQLTEPRALGFSGPGTVAPYVGLTVGWHF